MITVGHIAKTYGILPSEVIERASTYDIMITDVYTAWENHRQNPKDMSQFSQEQLQELLENTRK